MQNKRLKFSLRSTRHILFICPISALKATIKVIFNYNNALHGKCLLCLSALLSYLLTSIRQQIVSVPLYPIWGVGGNEHQMIPAVHLCFKTQRAAIFYQWLSQNSSGVWDLHLIQII